jgi:hypothetical protein
VLLDTLVKVRFDVGTCRAERAIRQFRDCSLLVSLCIGFIGITAAVRFIVLCSARISTILLSNQIQKIWCLDLELCAKVFFM